MKFKFPILILATFILAVTACKKDENTPDNTCNDPNVACFKATIDGEAFEATGATGIIASPFMTITGTTVSTTVSLATVIKSKGTYNFNENEDVFSLVQDALTGSPKTYVGSSGTYSLTTVDTINNILMGTFELEMKDDDTGTTFVSITEGSFSVQYN